MMQYTRFHGMLILVCHPRPTLGSLQYDEQPRKNRANKDLLLGLSSSSGLRTAEVCRAVHGVLACCISEGAAQIRHNLGGTVIGKFLEH